ncbi:MAG TPA: zf-HC2 domain-containing protein [Thermoanaerobaculia bacterium]|nr:zf-HC2 domain-containing protein [Thermoanaerobaculia bacterium]
MTAMDHAYAEEHGLVDAYLEERLSEGEREAFEAHYFDCDACMEQLEAASDFREGMLQVAAEDMARSAAARTQLGLLASLALLSRGWRLALGGALLLLLVLPLWLLVMNRSLQLQLATTRSAIPLANPALDQRIAGLEARLQTLQTSAARNQQRLEEELAKERQVRTTAEKGAAAGPQVNLPVFMLAAVRSGEEAGREPVNRIPLAATTPSVLFSLELATIDYPSYRASLRDESGKEIWQARGLRPDARDSLVILLPSAMLPGGAYRLTVEGLKADGPSVAVAAYPFRVVRSP